MSRPVPTRKTRSNRVSVLNWLGTLDSDHHLCQTAAEAQLCHCRAGADHPLRRALPGRVLRVWGRAGEALPRSPCDGTGDAAGGAINFFSWITEGTARSGRPFRLPVFVNTE